jgi:hypothetical protein
MKSTLLLLAGLIVMAPGTAPSLEVFDGPPGQVEGGIIFMTCVQSPDQLGQALVLARSIRTFGGSVAQVPVWLYLSSRLPAIPEAVGREMTDLGVEVRSYTAPEVSGRYLLGEKPFAAARAEEAATATAGLIVLLDPNTLVLSEPRELLLPPDKDFGFSPVHHQNVGSWYEAAPDDWWTRIYQVLDIPPASLWPMETLADRRIVRPYFNAGSLVVRPERGLLRAWARSFSILAADPEIARASAEGPHNTFLHQAALAGAAVKTLPRERMIQLSSRCNYPLFFDRFFEGMYRFDSLEEVATMRYEFSFTDLPAGWASDVRAPEGILEWITRQFTPGGDIPLVRE